MIFSSLYISYMDCYAALHNYKSTVGALQHWRKVDHKISDVMQLPGVHSVASWIAVFTVFCMCQSI